MPCASATLDGALLCLVGVPPAAVALVGPRRPGRQGMGQPPHTFFIVAPIDPINAIITIRLERHGSCAWGCPPIAQGSIFFLISGWDIACKHTLILSLLTILFVTFILLFACEVSYHWRSGERRSPGLQCQWD
jgi:hypothetical protein